MIENITISLVHKVLNNNMWGFFNHIICYNYIELQAHTCVSYNYRKMAFLCQAKLYCCKYMCKTLYTFQ